jgi:hypothetical protein
MFGILGFSTAQESTQMDIEAGWNTITSVSTPSHILLTRSILQINRTTQSSQPQSNDAPNNWLTSQADGGLRRSRVDDDDDDLTSGRTVTRREQVRSLSTSEPDN